MRHVTLVFAPGLPLNPGELATAAPPLGDPVLEILEPHIGPYADPNG